MTAFFMAWGMFWIVPCPVKKWDNKKYTRMLVCLPVIGLLMGGLWALLAWIIGLAGGLGLFGPALIFAFCPVITGFIHLDGYMDCADAVLSHRSLEEKHRILKDSHVGSFAVIMAILWALAGFSLAASGTFDTGYLYNHLLCLIFIPAEVRCCPALAIMTFKPLGTSGYASSHGAVKPSNIAAVGIQLVLYITVPPILFGLPGLSALAGAVGSTVTILYLRHNLKGMSGDISGAAITIGELCSLAALAFIK